MQKLSLEALKKRAEAIASEELLGTISGGLEAACHDKYCNPKKDVHIIICDNI